MLSRFVRASGQVLFADSAPPFSPIVQRGNTTSDTTSSNTTPTLTVAKPAGVVAGDLLVVGFAINAGSPIIGMPSGWNLIDTDNVIPSAVYYTGMAYLIAGGSEPSSYSFTVPSGNISRGQIALSAFVNVDPVTPLDQHSLLVDSTTTATHDSNPLTPAHDNALILGACAGNQNAVTSFGATLSTDYAAGVTQVNLAFGHIVQTTAVSQTNVCTGASFKGTNFIASFNHI